MNRQDLIDSIAGDLGVSKASADRFMDSFLRAVQDAVKSGEKVTLAGFGSFEKTAVPKKIGRNPKTGEPVDIPATFRPKFTPGSTFRDMVKK